MGQTVSQTQILTTFIYLLQTQLLGDTKINSPKLPPSFTGKECHGVIGFIDLRM